MLTKQHKNTHPHGVCVWMLSEKCIFLPRTRASLDWIEWNRKIGWNGNWLDWCAHQWSRIDSMSGIIKSFDISRNYTASAVTAVAATSAIEMSVWRWNFFLVFKRQSHAGNRSQLSAKNEKNFNLERNFLLSSFSSYRIECVYVWMALLPVKSLCLHNLTADGYIKRKASKIQFFVCLTLCVWLYFSYFVFDRYCFAWQFQCFRPLHTNYYTRC